MESTQRRDGQTQVRFRPVKLITLSKVIKA